jgi:hypothetical protein
MKSLLAEGRLPHGFYLIGDEAFSCSDQLLVPYSGRNLGAWKDSFNYHLSSMRQCVERSFALLTQRWGILWRPLRCEYSRWTLVLTVCAKLHNYCLDGDIPLVRDRFWEDVEEDDAPDVILNAVVRDDVEAPVVANTHATRRTNFTLELELKGIRRPNHAMINSRA